MKIIDSVNQMKAGRVYRVIQAVESDYLSAGDVMRCESVGRRDAYLRSTSTGAGTTVGRVSFIRSYTPLRLEQV